MAQFEPLSLAQTHRNQWHKSNRNIQLERWMPKEYDLPYIFSDFVLLTPRDILTKDDNWINSNDLRGDLQEYAIVFQMTS